jgi:CRISPR-associated protein Cas1
VDRIVLRIIDNGENFLELGNSIKTQLLGIATVDVEFEKGRSPLMVGIQSTTSSLVKCYELKARKIMYPVMKNFEQKKTRRYDLEDEEDIMTNIAAEEEVPYNKTINDEDEDELPPF